MRCGCGHVVSCGCECIGGKCPKCRTGRRFVIKLTKTKND